MSLVLGGMDTMGDDEDGGGFDVVGRGRRVVRSAAHVRVPTPRWMNASTSQGVSRPQEEMDFLPFDTLTLSTLTSGTLIGTPQRPFRGERLIMGAINSDGSDGAGNVVIDPAIFVGAVQIGSDQGGTPITMFAATAFGVRLSWPSAGQGTRVKIYVRLLTALGEGDSIVITASCVGRAMR